MNRQKMIKCPRCGKAAAWDENPDRPFCSERCRLIDLGAWVNEEYRVHGEKMPDAGDPEIKDTE